MAYLLTFFSFCSDVSSVILSGISSHMLSAIPSGLSSDILSAISPGVGPRGYLERPVDAGAAHCDTELTSRLAVEEKKKERAGDALYI